MGLKFKRQKPIGPYIADFACLELKLIIEADGGQHGTLGDAKRDAWFQEQGFAVLRFWNNEIVGQTEAVLAQIAAFVTSRLPSPPAPLPQAGEGSNPTLRHLFAPASPDVRADTLVILLPGAYDRPEDFLDQGFAADAHAGGIDLLLAELDLTGVSDGSLVRRLHHEVVLPARQLGHRRLWLGGISLGGLSALIHADRYPGAADGYCLLAPYPGNRTITGEIAAAGGLAAWEADDLPEGEGERRGWRALRRLAATLPAALWLGYGEADRFAPGHRLMAEVLPPERVACVAGGHDWAAWRALWRRFLASGLADGR